MAKKKNTSPRTASAMSCSQLKTLPDDYQGDLFSKLQLVWLNFCTRVYISGKGITHSSVVMSFLPFSLKKYRPSNYLGQWAVRLPTYCFDKDKGKYPCPCQNHVSVIGLSSKYQALSTKQLRSLKSLFFLRKDFNAKILR